MSGPLWRHVLRLFVDVFYPKTWYRMFGLMKESVLIQAWKIESMLLDPKVAETLRVPWRWTWWSFWKFTMTPPNFILSLHILSSWLDICINIFSWVHLGKFILGRKAIILFELQVISGLKARAPLVLPDLRRWTLSLKMYFCQPWPCYTCGYRHCPPRRGGLLETGFVMWSTLPAA